MRAGRSALTRPINALSSSAAGAAFVTRASDSAVGVAAAAGIGQTALIWVFWERCDQCIPALRSHS